MPAGIWIQRAEEGRGVRAKREGVTSPRIAHAWCRERLPDPATTGFAEMAPDLVVEVLSPDDRPGETLAKVGDWLEAGARLAWVIDPQRRLARIYRADGTESLLAESGALDGEDVHPGFNCPLRAIL